MIFYMHVVVHLLIWMLMDSGKIPMKYKATPEVFNLDYTEAFSLFVTRLC